MLGSLSSAHFPLCVGGMAERRWQVPREDAPGTPRGLTLPDVGLHPRAELWGAVRHRIRHFFAECFA